MGLGVVGQVLNTADMSATPPKYFHRFTPKIFFELKCVQLWVVKYGNPFSDPIGLELRSYSATGERILIATSEQSWGVSEISSEDYALKQLFFDFQKCPTLRMGTEYSVNLIMPLYVGTDDNHIAWVKAWPDPIVPFPGSDNFNRLDQFPFQVGLIGREVRP